MYTTEITTNSLPRVEPITKENMLQLFPDIESTSASLDGHDLEQRKLMDEVCIVIDEKDKPIGSLSKKICHLMTNIEKGLLHRAFSVFLFNSRNELLLQRRATEKITFPDMWTNTCCSHPLSIPSETGDDIEESLMGVKRAAQRKLGQELGVNVAQVPIEKFNFLTRIHYKASSDEIWGEHEIDYILFIKADVDLEPNLNETRETRYVTADYLRAMLNDSKLRFTPWFRLICSSLLFEWWEHIDGGLKAYTNEQKIRRM